VGLRLQLRKAQAEAGDIVLLYGDESEALTHPYLARAWAKRGADLRVPAPGQAKKVAMIGSLDHVTRQLIVHTSPTKRSSDFIAHLEQLDRLYGPQPGRAMKPVVLVEDNGTDPPQQARPCRPRSAQALAHRRVAAKIRARTQRHRGCLARSQSAQSRPLHLHRRRRPRSSHPSSCPSLKQRAISQSVGQLENLCLGPELHDLLIAKAASPGDRPKIMRHRAGLANVKSLVGAGFGVALGLFQDAAPAASSVTVNQVNVGESTALEAARRLAFALAKASQLDRPGQTSIGHAIETERKE